MGKAWANLDQSEKWSPKGIGAILKVEDAIAYRHYKVFRALRKKLNNKGGEHPTTFPDWWSRINSIDDDVAACAKEELESIILNHDRVFLLVDRRFADVYIPLFRYPQMIEPLSDREIRKMVERKRTSPFHTYKPTDELYNFPNNLVDNDNDELPNYSHDELEKLFYLWRCDESDYESTDQGDSDSDSDNDNDSEGNGSNGDGDDSITLPRSEVDKENDGGHNEGDEIQVDAE
ncbi:uncharacterized protein L199_006692 [Kwoniella botswanensis]|uniref:uncharacterized protein n=1 Tax=Kwoniella botswanensis TaxID=1268659 RepID=UPI00315DBD4A